MKFEFHAHLSHVGFDGVYPILDQGKQACHKDKHIEYKHAQRLSRSKQDTIWTKH